MRGSRYSLRACVRGWNLSRVVEWIYESMNECDWCEIRFCGNLSRSLLPVPVVPHRAVSIVT